MSPSLGVEIVAQIGAVAVAGVTAVVAIRNGKRIGKPNGQGNVVEMVEQLFSELSALRGAFEERGHVVGHHTHQLDSHERRIGVLEGSKQ